MALTTSIWFAASEEHSYFAFSSLNLVSEMVTLAFQECLGQIYFCAKVTSKWSTVLNHLLEPVCQKNPRDGDNK